MTVLRLLDIALVAVAYWMPLMAYKRRDLSLEMVAGVQIVAIVVSMVASSHGLWPGWIGIMLLVLVLVSTLLTVLLYREEERSKSAC